jgi:hypothetical protein
MRWNDVALLCIALLGIIPDYVMLIFAMRKEREKKGGSS